MVRFGCVLWLFAATACSFDRKELDGRICDSSDECEPDEACTKGVCLLRPCTTPADCGSDYAFACTSGGCAVQECNTDSECGGSFVCPAGYCGFSFNVVSAMSNGSTSVSVLFDGEPEQFFATTLASYMISGLGVSGTPTLSGTTVTVTTAPQSAVVYSLTVLDVTRASDDASLMNATASFTGRTTLLETPAEREHHEHEDNQRGRRKARGTEAAVADTAAEHSNQKNDDQ